MPGLLTRQRKFILADSSTGRQFLCTLPESHILVKIFDQIETDMNWSPSMYFWLDYYVEEKGASYLASCIYACSRDATLIGDNETVEADSRLQATSVEIFDDVFRENCNTYAQAFYNYSGLDFESPQEIAARLIT